MQAVTRSIETNSIGIGSSNFLSCIDSYLIGFALEALLIVASGLDGAHLFDLLGGYGLRPLCVSGSMGDRHPMAVGAIQRGCAQPQHDDEPDLRYP